MSAQIIDVTRGLSGPRGSQDPQPEYTFHIGSTDGSSGVAISAELSRFAELKGVELRSDHPNPDVLTVVVDDPDAMIGSYLDSVRQHGGTADAVVTSLAAHVIGYLIEDVTHDRTTAKVWSESPVDPSTAATWADQLLALATRDPLLPHGPMSDLSSYEVAKASWQVIAPDNYAAPTPEGLRDLFGSAWRTARAWELSDPGRAAEVEHRMVNLLGKDAANSELQLDFDPQRGVVVGTATIPSIFETAPAVLSIELGRIQIGPPPAVRSESGVTSSLIQADDLLGLPAIIRGSAGLLLSAGEHVVSKLGTKVAAPHVAADLADGILAGGVSEAGQAVIARDIAEGVDRTGKLVDPPETIALNATTAGEIAPTTSAPITQPTTATPPPAENVAVVPVEGAPAAADIGQPTLVVGEGRQPVVEGAGGAGGAGAGGVGGAEPTVATSDNMYEISANALPVPPHPAADTAVRVEGRGNPDRIMHHDNSKLFGVTDVTVADHAAVAQKRGQIEAAGGPPAVGGLPHGDDATGSMLPASVGENVPVPLETRPAASPNNIGKPLPTELRTHAEDPALHDPANRIYNPDAHSANNPTTVFNTDPRRGPAEYLDPSTGTFGRPNAEAHMPAGGRDRGPTGLGATPENPAGTGPAGPGRLPVEPGDYSLYGERPTAGGPVHETYGRPTKDSLPEGMADEVDVILDPARYGAAGPYQAPDGGGRAPAFGMSVALGQGFDPSHAVDPGQMYGMSMAAGQGFDPSRAPYLAGPVSGTNSAGSQNFQPGEQNSIQDPNPTGPPTQRVDPPPSGEGTLGVDASSGAGTETAQQYGSPAAESVGQDATDNGSADDDGARSTLFGQHLSLQISLQTDGYSANTTEPGFDPSRDVDPGQTYGMSVVAGQGFDPSQDVDPGQAYGMSIATEAIDATQVIDPGHDYAVQASGHGTQSAGNTSNAETEEQSTAVASQGADQSHQTDHPHQVINSPSPYVPPISPHVETYQPEQVYQAPQQPQSRNF